MAFCCCLSSLLAAALPQLLTAKGCGYCLLVIRFLPLGSVLVGERNGLQTLDDATFTLGSCRQALIAAKGMAPLFTVAWLLIAYGCVRMVKCGKYS